MANEEPNRLEDLKESLYSRNAPEVRTRRKLRFADRTVDLKTDWDHPDSEEDKDTRAKTAAGLDYQPQKKHMSLFTKILIASAIFCVAAVSTGAYLFFNGSNFISGNNIDVTISGPVSIPGGTPISLDITVVNKNSVTLKGADLAVQFPAGTTNPNDTTIALDTHQELLGDIAPGGSVTRTVKAIIFGEQNLQKEVTATITYGIQGSSSVFTKVQTYDVLINSSPVTLNVTALSEASSGSNFDLTVDVHSNSVNVLKNVLLSAVYPFGYKFTSASLPSADNSNTVWNIGDLPPGGSRSITIHGVLTGEDGDLRAFHFSTGARNPDSILVIGTPYASTEADVTIKKPFMSLVVSVNNDNSTADYIGNLGRSVTVFVRWSNNTPNPLTNAIISAHLTGGAYDKSQVNALSGYFRSIDDNMIWNQQTNQELASVAAGATGNVSFAIVPSLNQQNNIINPEITIAASVTADRTDQSNVPLNTEQVVRNIKVPSTLSLSGRVLRNEGPFTNTGPIPPQAEAKTTYTITWAVDNTSSVVNNAVVTATLPPYVTWLNQVSPSSEDVSYDSNSGTVTWNVGTVGTYTAGTTRRREASFQVSLLPSVDQIGQAPVLVNQANLTGTDTWTNTTLKDTQSYLTTSYSTDSSFQNGFETVVKKP